MSWNGMGSAVGRSAQIRGDFGDFFIGGGQYGGGNGLVPQVPLHALIAADGRRTQSEQGFVGGTKIRMGESVGMRRR